MLTYKVILFVLMVSLSFGAPQGTRPSGDNNPNRKYKFNYVARDDPTNSQHSRFEEKIGDVVRGEYTIMEPTGQIRVVQYYADKTGFYANVDHRSTDRDYVAGPTVGWNRYTKNG